MLIFYLEQFITVITILTSLGTLFGIILPLAKKIFMYHNKIKYRKKTLHLMNKNVLITCGSFSRKEDIHDVAGLNEVKCIKTVMNLCSTVKAKTYFQDEYAQTDIDEIHIGGPQNNTTVNTLMADYFEGRFKFIDDTESGVSFGTEGKEKYTVNSKYGDYAILTRIIDPKERKSIHILFGCFELGTVKAIEYFTKHSKEIYDFMKKCKLEKSNYFFMLHVNNDGRHDPHIGLTDLTEVMFDSVL